MKKRNIGRMVAIASLSLFSVSGSGLADTSSVIPWYVNPTLRARLYTGNDTLETVGLDVGADGETLLMTAQANGGQNLQCFVLSSLAALSGVKTNACFEGETISFGSAPLGAVSTGALLAVENDLSSARSLVAGAIRWVGAAAPEIASFASSDHVSSVDFNAAGTALYANSLTEGRRNLLVRWDSFNGAFTQGATINTGLTSVDAVSVYKIGGVEYAVVADGCAGQIRLVRISDGTVQTAISDAANLTSRVRAVKMSHTDYFRPRFYVLLETGDVLVYCYRPDLSTATYYSKTLTNADLLALANAPWSAADATITALEVSPDGKFAVIGYASKTGNETASGPAYLAVLRHEPRSWTYYEPNQDINPLGNIPCISDGKYLLGCTWVNGNLMIGYGDQSNPARREGNAYANTHMEEYLDLSHGVCYYRDGSISKNFPIRGNLRWALGTNSVGRAPRVLVHSTRMNTFDQPTRGWNHEGTFEEIVLSSTLLTSIPAWSGPYNVSKTFVMDLPNLTSVADWSIYTQNNMYLMAKNDFSDLKLPMLATIGQGAFAQHLCSGVLTLPSAVDIKAYAFARCRNMEEARLSADAKCLTAIRADAFNANVSASGLSKDSGTGRLRRVVIGGASGLHIYGSSAFANNPLEEVVFTGAVPEFDGDVTVAWPDTAAQSIVFAVPRGDAAWAAALEGKVSSSLTEEQQKSWRLAHPGTCIPHGVVDKSVFKTAFDQYIAYNDTQGGCTLTIERNDFFDDEVEVTSDWGADADGKYRPGTIVTLTARPGVNGTFLKWYGDVEKNSCTNTQISFAITNDTWIYARFVHPWRLSSDKTTATDGNFTVNVRSADATRHTLTFSKSERFGLYADTDIGQGVLDLGGPILLDGDETPWTCVGLGSDSTQGRLLGKVRGKGAARAVIFPTTITAHPGGQFLHTYTDGLARLFDMLIIDAPNMTGGFYAWMTGGQNNLAYVILDAPKVTSFEEGIFSNSHLTRTKLDWWNLSGLWKLRANALWVYHNPQKAIQASGTLTLPSMRNVVASDGGLSPFRAMGGVEGFALGGLDQAVTVTNICANAFAQDASLKTLTLHNSEDIVIGLNPFDGGRVPDSIVFTGPAPTTGSAFENLLSDVTASETKPVKIYASRMMPGWLSTAYIDYSPTTAERAEAPGEQVIGVYRGGATAPNGKALVIHRPSPFDPKGTIIVFR